MNDKPQAPAPPDRDLAEQVYGRVKRRLVLWYALSLLVGAVVGGSLAWHEAELRALSNQRIAEYRRLVAEKLDELHKLDLDVARLRTRVDDPCPQPLAYGEVTQILRENAGMEPASSQVSVFLESAADFGICETSRVRRILSDAPTIARVDTVFRLVLRRPADPVGRFIYGHWLQSGMDPQAVARDLMASSEFLSARDKPDSLQRALREFEEQGLSEYRLLVADRLDELHALDLEEVSRRTRRERDCPGPLPRPQAAALLMSELGSAPQENEVDELVARANAFGLCDVASVKRVYEDKASMAAIDTLYRVLLRRPSDPFGRLIYGYWMAKGIPIEAAARDIMSSGEFRKLRRLGEP